MRDIYRRFTNADKRLCKCKKCAENAGDKPIYERVPYLKQRTCSDHMLKQGNARPRGRPSAVSLSVASVIPHGPSFFSVHEIVSAKIADLRAAAGHSVSRHYQPPTVEEAMDFQGQFQDEGEEAGPSGRVCVVTHSSSQW